MGRITQLENRSRRLKGFLGDGVHLLLFVDFRFLATYRGFRCGSFSSSLNTRFSSRRSTRLPVPATPTRYAHAWLTKKLSDSLGAYLPHPPIGEKTVDIRAVILRGDIRQTSLTCSR